MKTDDNTINPVTDDFSELESLRNQVRELKTLLAASRITNDRVLRKAMDEKSGWLGRFVKMEIALLPIIIFVLMAFSVIIGASIWPIIVMVIISGISTWLDWHTLRIASANILDMPMLALKTSLERQKKYRKIQTLVEIPIAVLWQVWYFYSIKIALTPGTEFDRIITYSIFGGGIIGGIIAAIFISIIYRKAQKTNSELIESIDSAEP